LGATLPKSYFSTCFPIPVSSLVSILPDFDPADALFYSQVFNGILLPIIMIVLLMLSNDARVFVMERSPFWINIMAVVTILIALAANFATLSGN
jgi:Mn2+/Fe2+ NRAMP family transporter